MPVWNVPDVASQPTVRISRWCVFRHTLKKSGESADILVGWNLDGGEGRTSTNIVAFDPAAAVVHTRSGRRYQLVGEPGHDPDGIYVFHKRFGADVPLGASREEVTATYWGQILEARDS